MQLARPIAVVATVALLAACGGGGVSQTSPSPTRAPTASPSPSPAATVFTAALSPVNEVPPVTNAENSASGTVTITFDLTRDATGRVTAATAKFDVVTRGFPASTTTFSGAHIHEGAAGAIGGVKINTGITANEVTLSGGGATFSKTVANIQNLADVESIIRNPAGWYFNIHTPANAGGVLRGQLAAR